MELSDEILSPFPSLEDLCDPSPDQPLGHQQFIHLDGYTVSCTTIQLDEEETADWYLKPDSGQQYVKVVRGDDTSIYLLVHWDKVLKEHELSKKPLTVILVSDLNTNMATTIVVLIVEELNGHAERIGISTDQFARWKWNYGEKNAKQYNWTPFPRWKLRELASMNAKRRMIRLG
jgi:hypothetical protein